MTDGQRLLLHFGAVDTTSIVWINGQPAARHEGGYTPFRVDVTPLHVSSEPQTVVVRAFDDPLDLAKPRGKQDWLLEPHSIWYPRTTGIWQTVWLERVPSKNQSVRAAIAGMEAIGSVDRRARFVHVDPVIHVIPSRDRPDLAAEAAAKRAAQFCAIDMLAGRTDPELGGDAKYLDIVGLNFYHPNEWKLPENRLRWEDSPRDERWVPLHRLLLEVHKRYRRPLCLTETSHFGVGALPGYARSSTSCGGRWRCTARAFIPLWIARIGRIRSTGTTAACGTFKQMEMGGCSASLTLSMRAYCAVPNSKFLASSGTPRPPRAIC